MKKQYIKPTIKVLEFKPEQGFAGSTTNFTFSHEGFEAELCGNEQFIDNTPTDINDDNIDWHFF